MKIFNKQKAQTAIELAIFGTILIFTLGTIVRSALGRGHQQHSVLKATRMALSESYTTSADMWNASRNSASVLIIEDRLTAASAKYGAIDRAPLMVQGSGSHSANLFMPVDFNNPDDLPLFDVFVNGRRFSFTSSGFTSYPLPATVYTIVDNHPSAGSKWCDGVGIPCPASNLSADERFDLDRNDLDGIPGDVSVPVAERPGFAWQWYEVKGALEKGDEVDVDDDLKLERVMEDVIGGAGSVNVMDFQRGDLDFTHNDSDPGISPGFTNDVRIYTFVRSGGPGEGTYLEIDEGKLFSGIGDSRQFIRTASKKDSIDIIERIMKLSNNTGRFCPSPDGVGINGVEWCSSAKGGCQSSVNLQKTCMDTANLFLYIRSRVADLHGRKWVTDVSGDGGIDF